MKTHDLFIDACVLINLYASLRLEEIAHSSAYQLVLTREATRESLFIEEEGQVVPIELGSFFEAGILVQVDLTEDEISTMVDFAQELDEGEASTLSAAQSRGAALATDDRGALRFIQKRGLGIHILGTSDLVRGWADTGQKAEDVRETLRRIEDRARFRPSPRDPHAPWWESVLRSDG